MIVKFETYKNPEAVGWLGWFAIDYLDDRFETYFVGLDYSLLLVD